MLMSLQQAIISEKVSFFSLFGFMGSAYYLVPEESETELYNPTNLALDKYFWWFVIHLWVEGA